MLKIIGGEFRSRKLLTPEDDEITRPYAARVKESVFNILRGWFEGARVLDLFAGVGTMGLEAVSRGASQVVMVEQQRAVFRLLEENIRMLDCGDRARALQADALSAGILGAAPAPVDIVFMDPPYAMMQLESSQQRILAQASRLRDVMAPKSFLVLRTPINPACATPKVDGFDGPEIHAYGQEMWVLLYCPTAAGVSAEAVVGAGRT